MQTSKLAKGLVNYLALLTVTLGVLIGLFIAQDLYPTPVDSQL